MRRNYRIEFNKRYLKDLKKIPVYDQRKIYEKILSLAVDPRPEGCKKLQSSLKNPLYRVRCGDYHVVYSVYDSHLVVLIVRLGNRREIYRS